MLHIQLLEDDILPQDRNIYMEIGLLHQLSEFIGTNFRGKGGIFNNYSGRGGHRGGQQGYPNPGYQNFGFQPSSYQTS